MLSTTVLVADERPAPPKALLDALREADVTTTVRSVRSLLTGPVAALPAADVLLAHAGAGTRPLRHVVERMRDQGSTPSVVVYATEDFGALTQHVRVGHDYLVPPFLPELVGARLRRCSERAELGRTAREADSRAELVAYEKELQIGRQIQAGFLPESLPVPAGWEIAVRFRPARQVAGDFYDVFELVHRRRLAVVVADVCDKGVGSALFMALIRSLLRHTAESSGLQHLVAADPFGDLVPVVGATPLLDAVTATNGYLTRNHLRQGYFATLFFGVLDPLTGSLVYVNGGHNPPFLLNGDGGEPVPLEVTGPAVGVLPDCRFSLGYCQLDPGSTLFVYTDGVTEARRPDGGFFGDDRMLALLRGPAVCGRDLLERVDEEVRRHTGTAEQHDDVTMLALHRPPPASRSAAGLPTAA